MKLYSVRNHNTHIIEAILVSTLNISLCIETKNLNYSLTWRFIINPHWLELPMYRTNLNSPKDVRTIS